MAAPLQKGSIPVHPLWLESVNFALSKVFSTVPGRVAQPAAPPLSCLTTGILVRIDGFVARLTRLGCEILHRFVVHLDTCFANIGIAAETVEVAFAILALQQLVSRLIDFDRLYAVQAALGDDRLRCLAHGTLLSQVAFYATRLILIVGQQECLTGFRAFTVF